MSPKRAFGLARKWKRAQWDEEDYEELAQYIEAVKADVETLVLTGKPIRLNS